MVTSKSIYSCLVCNSSNIASILDIKAISVCHKFSKNTKKRDLIIGYCQDCSLVQMLDLFPISEIVPIYKWINYKEPETHLDEVTKTITKKYITDKNIKIYGLSEKDYSLIERFRKKGFLKSDIFTKKDLKINRKIFGIESVQESINYDNINKLKKKIGKIDLLISRHTFEHSYDPNTFFKSIFEIISNDGYLLLEVPDYKTSFLNYRYSYLWEEHTMYFTPRTIINTVINLGFRVNYVKIFKYSHENCLTLLISRKSNKNFRLKKENIKIYDNYSKNFTRFKKKLINWFRKLKLNNQKIAIYGTGHASIMFINQFKIEEYISLVVDDNINKIGLYLPNSRLKIKKPSFLIDEEIKYCLISASAESAEKIVNKNVSFTKNEGLFLNIDNLYEIL